MLSTLKAIWSRGVSGRAGGSAEPAIPTIEYKGYRIRPAPVADKGQYRIAGTIEKDSPGGVSEHRFVRADMSPSRDDAIEFTVAKAKQIIDQQGDSIFS